MAGLGPIEVHQVQVAQAAVLEHAGHGQRVGIVGLLLGIVALREAHTLAPDDVDGRDDAEGVVRVRHGGANVGQHG
jgi:hypothetical protein